jgi:hypothetical protein
VSFSYLQKETRKLEFKFALYDDAQEPLDAEMKMLSLAAKYNHKALVFLEPLKVKFFLLQDSQTGFDAEIDEMNCR